MLDWNAVLLRTGFTARRGATVEDVADQAAAVARATALAVRTR